MLNHCFLNNCNLNTCNLNSEGYKIYSKEQIEIITSNILLEDGKCMLTEESKYIILEK